MILRMTPRKLRHFRFIGKVFLISLSAGIVLLALVAGVVWAFKDRILTSIALYVPPPQLPKIAETPVIPLSGGEVIVAADSAVVPEEKDIPLSVSEVVAKADDSVVSITLTNSVGRILGKGTGFFVTKDGLIVTNRHVVDTSGASFTVTTTDGKERSATLVAIDPVLDIALVRVAGSGFTPLVLGNSNTLSTGQSVIAIGYALGTFQNSVSVGVVSGLSRSVVARGNNGDSTYLDAVIQTDAAINKGNSGGPLLNLKGEVIGVNAASALTSQSIGFALPINDVKQAITSVQKTGRIIRPYVGVRYTQITPDVASERGLSVNYGVIVEPGRSQADIAVLPGSPAAIAGIMSGDIILSLNGVKLDQARSFASLIRQKTVGATVTLLVLRNGVTAPYTVTLAEASAL
ncbi:MAG: S1C family serine protease [Minisyncoccia bacterium]